MLWDIFDENNSNLQYHSDTLYGIYISSVYLVCTVIVLFAVFVQRYNTHKMCKHVLCGYICILCYVGLFKLTRFTAKNLTVFSYQIISLFLSLKMWRVSDKCLIVNFNYSLDILLSFYINNIKFMIKLKLNYKEMFNNNFITNIAYLIFIYKVPLTWLSLAIQAQTI